MLKAVQNSKPTVSPIELVKYDEFTKEFGEI